MDLWTKKQHQLETTLIWSPPNTYYLNVYICSLPLIAVSSPNPSMSLVHTAVRNSSKIVLPCKPSWLYLTHPMPAWQLTHRTRDSKRILWPATCETCEGSEVERDESSTEQWYSFTVKSMEHIQSQNSAFKQSRARTENQIKLELIKNDLNSKNRKYRKHKVQK